MPARHCSRATRNRQVAACPRARDDAGGPGDRSHRALPPVRRGHHVLAAGRDLPGRGCRGRACRGALGRRARGDLLVGQEGARAACPRAAGRARRRRHPVGRADPPRPPGASRRLDAGRSAPAPLPGASRPHRRSPVVGYAVSGRDAHARAALPGRVGRADRGAPRPLAAVHGHPRQDRRRGRGQSALRRAAARDARRRGRPRKRARDDSSASRRAARFASGRRASGTRAGIRRWARVRVGGARRAGSRRAPPFRFARSRRSSGRS